MPLLQQVRIGSPVSGGTSGSALFVDSNAQLQQDNANFFWDDTNNRLGILTNAPDEAIQLSSSTASFKLKAEAATAGNQKIATAKIYFASSAWDGSQAQYSQATIHGTHEASDQLLPYLAMRFTTSAGQVERYRFQVSGFLISMSAGNPWIKFYGNSAETDNLWYFTRRAIINADDFVFEDSGTNRVWYAQNGGGAGARGVTFDRGIIVKQHTTGLSLASGEIVRFINGGSGNEATVPLKIDGMAAQSGDLQQWRNSTPTILLSVAAAGHLTFGEGINLIAGTTTGTKIGTATTQKLGFYNATPIVQPTATGSRGGNAALASLLTQLASLGLVVDGTSA